MQDTRINVRVRGGCGGSVDCAVTEKPDRSVWFEMVVKVPGHTGLRIDLSKAVSVDNLVNAVIQYVDSRPGSYKLLYPATVSNSSLPELEDCLIRVATRGELDQALRNAFEPLVW
jgi:hypothetical protein